MAFIAALRVVRGSAEKSTFEGDFVKEVNTEKRLSDLNAGLFLDEKEGKIEPVRLQCVATDDPLLAARAFLLERTKKTAFIEPQAPQKDPPPTQHATQKEALLKEEEKQSEKVTAAAAGKKHKKKGGKWGVRKNLRGLRAATGKGGGKAGSSGSDGSDGDGNGNGNGDDTAVVLLDFTGVGEPFSLPRGDDYVRVLTAEPAVMSHKEIASDGTSYPVVNVVTEVGLWRSQHWASPGPVRNGWDGCSSDLNKGRGGDYLYLCWKCRDVAVSPDFADKIPGATGPSLLSRAWRGIKNVTSLSDETEESMFASYTFMREMLKDVPVKPFQLQAALQAVVSWESREYKEQVYHAVLASSPSEEDETATATVASGGNAQQHVCEHPSGEGKDEKSAAPKSEKRSKSSRRRMDQPPIILATRTAEPVGRELVEESLFWCKFACAAYGWKLLHGFKNLRVAYNEWDVRKLGIGAMGEKFKETNAENMRILCLHSGLEPDDVIDAKWTSDTGNEEEIKSVFPF
jgi:hypothetical protein